MADVEFAKLLNELLAKVILRKPKEVRFEYGFHSVSYDCAILYDFLQQGITCYSKLIENYPENFLRGFFDAEGYVSPLLNHVAETLDGIRVGVANSNPKYLSCVEKQLVSMEVFPAYHKTHEAGELMTIRGKTFVRKHDVSHLVIRDHLEIETFKERVDFSVPVKKEKLADLIRIANTMTDSEGYDWFVTHYERRNRRWVKRPETTKK